MSDWESVKLPRFYRRDGTPYPEGKAGLHEKMEMKRVALDVLPNGLRVSTVWLGLDHRLIPPGRPLIFETMLFTRGGQSIGEEWRYSTEEEALRGHKTLVKKWSTFKTAEQVLMDKPT